jgi:tellurite resistance-related uncharacterized protein
VVEASHGLKKLQMISYDGGDEVTDQQLLHCAEAQKCLFSPNEWFSPPAG